jgi:cyclophilin family peptidyl-prolyl cis-trans isomerase
MDALESMGVKVPEPAASKPVPNDQLTAGNLNTLVAPRARVTVRGVGVFDMALVVAEAPGTVARFIHLAESGYYSGTTFHGLVPDVAIHGGSPGASDYVGHPTPFRDEVGAWPHVRGAVGLSSRGRDTGDGRFFINLVDNPRFDHEFTVFAQILNGMDVVDRLLEGDLIERIEILR